MGIFEGVAIIAAAMFIMLVSSIADNVKDKKFLKLNDMNKEETVPVIRGKFGATQSISIWNLVVGDIVMLSHGTRVPADCIVIQSSDLEVVEKGKDFRIPKGAAPSGGQQGGDNYPNRQGLNLQNEQPGLNEDNNADCFLRADSLIMRGMCKALVTVVGKNSSRGDHVDDMALDVDTPLQ